MSTALTLHGLDRDKIDLIKQTVAKGATDLELQLFLHACERTGLDPLMKQLYAIKRWSAVDGRDVMTFQTGIDGLRLIADRTGQYAGSDEPVFQLGEDGFPDVASVTVYKLVGSLKCAFTHSVRWKEYVQCKKDGTPTSFWVKMPFGQLGKCAESGALRKADTAPLPTTKTFAEKFPEQAKAIAAKLQPPAPDTAQTDDAGGATLGHGMASPQQASDASAPLTPPEPYRRTLAACDNTNAAINAWWGTVPEEIRQDLYSDYTVALKKVGKKTK
jgi:phage recombination protein Bet